MCNTSVMITGCFILAVSHRTQVWEPVTVLHYCLTVDLSVNQIWVCNTAVKEKPPVQRDEIHICACSDEKPVVLLYCLYQMGHTPGITSSLTLVMI